MTRYINNLLSVPSEGTFFTFDFIHYEALMVNLLIEMLKRRRD